MIRYLILLQFVVIFVGDYVFKKMGLRFKLFSILPEMISFAVGFYVFFFFAFGKGAKIQLRYLYFFVSFAVHITIGIIGNQVQPLAIFAGMRTYLNFLPFFLLPLVYDQPDDQVRSQLRLLLALAIVQLPLALYQRVFEYSDQASGDYIAGTLIAAPNLTLFMIGTIAVILGFYLKKRLSVKMFVVLIVCAFIPTAINETKATVILLPIALLIPLLFEVKKEQRIKIIATVIPVGVVIIVGFHYIYKIVYPGRSDVVAFYTTDKAVDYLYKGAQAGQVTGEYETEVGRIDSIVLAYKESSKDFFRLVWGAGIGNAAVSFSKKLQGEYTREYLRLGGKQNSLSHFIWEIGLLGIVHIVCLFLLIFIDAVNLCKSQDLVGPLALGWLGVTAILLVALPYQNLITKNAVVYPFCYFSGLLAAKSCSNKRIR
jgi:hypothetical protein